MARPYAAFDIDGTVIRWQLYHAIADDLAKHGQLDPQGFAAVRAARMQWKKRAHAESYHEYERVLIELFDSALTSLTADDIMAACRRVIDEYKDQVYTYTRDLIRQLKAQNYLLFAISGSQREIVGMLADYYGFDDYGGSVYEIKDGRYTGQQQILHKEQKPAFIKGLVKKHAATTKGSIAVGDSQNDILMLSSVERPIAFNPTAELFEHARAHDWSVIVERKNMVYQLEPSDGGYKLA